MATQFIKNAYSCGALSFAIAMALSACSGGGGSNVLPTVSAPVTVTPTPPPAPVYSYPQYSHLVPTGALAAQQAGFTGAGVKIGVLDSGVDPALAPFVNRVAWFQSYLADGNATVATGTGTPNDTLGHGSLVTQLMAGTAAGGFVGGVAPDASLYIAQVCTAADTCAAYSQAYIDLTAQGVHLFNQSFGAVSPDPAATLTVVGLTPNGQPVTFTSEYQPMIAAGDLFVWAAGNEGPLPSNLNVEAAAPYYLPSLQPGWLAVVNVELDGAGKLTRLDPTSATCGVAVMWCLSAPGNTETLGVPGTIFSAGFANGTSASTAIVTGVAAQVWQAYPWMSGTDVQQTLLTTATLLGGSTAPDATYGWGMVNAAKAVNGPAQFAFGAYNADVVGFNSTFSNAISGTGSLVLTGTTGTLTLSAANTYTGGTTIDSGNLALSGSLASDVNVVGGGFGGAGTVNGSVSNASLVTSQSATGGKGLSITGNYTATAGSTTAIGIGNPLTVGGTAAVAGTLQLLAPPTTYTPLATETLINAGSLTGTFANQTTGAGVFYSSVLNYTPTALTDTLTRQATAQSVPVAAPVTLNAAQGIDSALKLADQWSTTNYTGHATFLNTAAQFLSARTQAQAVASINSLDGEIYGTTSAIESQQALLTDDAMALRQNDLTAGEQPGVWVQSSDATGTLSQDTFASAHYHLGGALFGLDTQIIGNLSGGFVLGRSYLDANLAGLAGRVNGRDDTMGLYGRYAFANGGYVAGRANWSNEQVTVQRTALIGSTLQSIGGTRKDGIAQATIEAGKAFTLGQGTLTPYASVSALRLDQAGFTEQGAGGFGLTSPAQRHNATLADVGLRFGHGFDWAGGQSVLSGYAFYRRVLTGANLGFTAALAGAPTAQFTAQGQDLTRNTEQMGATFNTQVNATWGWFINVDAQASRGRSHGVGANAGVRVRF